MAVRDGVIVFSQPGALPESALESLIEQVEKLDMDDVRKQLAAAQATELAAADRPRTRYRSRGPSCVAA